MGTRACSAVVALLLCAAGCHRQPVRMPTVTVAAAANLQAVFVRIGPAFEAATGIHPIFSFGSTAQLASQIENGAPFDLFAAADREHVDALVSKGKVLAGSRAIYARGVLALWTPPGARVQVSRLEDLSLPSVRVIAIAKPELAPYGAASVEALRKLGLWERVEPKVVYAQNINMAREYAASGNADAVFTAYSLVLQERGTVVPVPQNLHRPLDQALGIIARSANQDAARRFTDFLLNGQGRQLLRAAGYQ